MSRPQSRKSKNIIKFIEAGLRPFEITAKGYSKYTVRYHYRKIKNPKKHEKFVSKIMALNKASRERNKE
jgi:hypothetical protein